MKAITTIAKLYFVCFILVPVIISVSIANLPLVGILLACKYIEAYVYFYLYDAEQILDYNFFKLSSGPGKNIRTTLIIIDGKVELNDITDLVVTSLIDAHTKDGLLCFPQLTKQYLGGFMNNYWVEEDNFNLSDHIFIWKGEVVYTVQLQDVLARLRDEGQNAALSPWSITVIPLQLGKTAIAVRCHPALKDLDLVETLLTKHNLCNHKKADRRYFMDHGPLRLIKCLFLLCLNLPEFILNRLRTRGLASEESSVRKVLMWSKPIDIKIFEEMAKRLNVSINEVLLGCVSYIVSDLDTFSPCSLSIAQTSNPISVNSFPIQSGRDDPVSAIIESKERLSELSSSGKLLMSTLFEHISNLILPISFANYLVRQVGSGVKVNITTLLADNEDVPLLSHPIDMISVWSEENNESAIEICLTNTLGQLVIATDAHHTVLTGSQHLFQQFEEVANRLEANA